MVNKILSILIAFFFVSCEKIAIQHNTLNEVKKLASRRIVDLDVECLTFDGKVKKLKLNVLDTCSESIRAIFKELLDKRFPIYAAACYNNKTISRSKNPSIHAYGTAIDINYLMNPFYIMQKGTTSIIPSRDIDRGKDEQQISGELRKINLTENEINAVLKVVIQPEGSDDWFMNRALPRKGMITSDQVKIFKKNGFDIWGGEWSQPIDFMHFQCSKELAYKMISAKNNDEAKELWDNHLKSLK